jgi:hypothetical protein
VTPNNSSRISNLPINSKSETGLRSLNANGVDDLLTGGYALAAHGYQWFA